MPDNDDAMPAFSLPDLPEGSCISLIGMAGAGKTTIGRLAARMLGWAFLDSDHVIEATYAACLQDVSVALGKEGFIDTEAEIVGSLRLCRTVIATGGSVVYRESTMQHLRELGPVAYLNVPMETVLERIARNPDRGLAIAPGQSVEDLFREREELYRKYATVTVDAGSLPPRECALLLLQRIAGQP